MKTHELVDFLDDLLNVKNIPDSSRNGLQVENSGETRKIALAVDACAEAVDKAAVEGADFLLVHHGLFWDQPLTITGPTYGRIKKLVQTDMALYGAHLPLDLHPEVGNNAQLVKRLGFDNPFDFGQYHGIDIGKAVELDHPISPADFEKRLRDAGFKPQIWPFGPDRIRRIGVVSGFGLSCLAEAARKGFDAFVTGEPSHSHYWFAKESRIHAVFAGHYATETLGVQALGDVIQSRFGIENVFIDLPTGH
jgi:dinuclear metal center YbgI/SA1388 family protein